MGKIDDEEDTVGSLDTVAADRGCDRRSHDTRVGPHHHQWILRVYGRTVVTAVGGNCATYGITVGREYNVRILPPSLGTNPAQFRFNVYDREYGEMVFYPSVPGTTFLTAVQAAFGARGYGNISPLPQMLLTTKPASYSTSTIGVVYEGKIKNFVNTGAQTTGQCDISFRAGGVLKP